MTYDLRRLGPQADRADYKFLRTLARLAAPASSPGLTAASRAYATAIDDLARQAGLTA